MDDLTGMRFGRMTVLSCRGLHVTPCGTMRRLWECRCDCGTVKTVQEPNLKNGSTKSCGCWKHERIKAHNTKHGGVHDRLYGIWKSMKYRCNNPKDSHFGNYGGKGFYRQSEIYGEFGTMYEHWNSPAQRFKITPVGVDKRTGGTIFKFPNVKSKKAFASGGYGLFIVGRVG